MRDRLGQHKRFEQRTFSGLDARATSVEAKHFHDCTFERCDLSETRFSGCRFETCRFLDCDLSVAQVATCVFVETRFERCKAIGINWTVVKTSLHPLEATFQASILNYSSFMGMDLRRVAFDRCTLREVNFGEANLSDVVFEHTDLSGSDFLHTDLSRADFRTAKHYAINLNDNTVKATQFSFPEAISLLASFDIIVDLGHEHHLER